MIQHDAGGGRRERERGRASCAVSKQRYFPEMFPATSSRHVTMHRSRKFLARRMSRIPLSFIFIFILHATHAYTCTHTHTHTLSTLLNSVHFLAFCTLASTLAIRSQANYSASLILQKHFSLPYRCQVTFRTKLRIILPASTGQ
jgi:hypothetical protein